MKITRTTTFRPGNLYRDKGSFASMDVAFWRPLPPEGFHLLGDYAQGNYRPPNGSMIVAQDSGDDSQPALVLPRDFDCIWSDRGSGADEDGSIWWPAAPTGYVAMGGVVTQGYDKPRPKDVGVYCVRKDLTTEGRVAYPLIWNDKGSGADGNVSIYHISTANPEGIAVGAFYPQRNYGPPMGTVYCLNKAYWQFADD